MNPSIPSQNANNSIIKGIIIILGSLNDEQGSLPELATSKIAVGIKAYKKHSGYRILCTGGFGDHFNRAEKSHAYYVSEYLVQKGIPREDILEFAESSNTIEDATLAKTVVDKYKVKNLIIVSWDFHMKRVRYIFKRVFRGYKIEFSQSETRLPEDLLRKRLGHEAEALRKLKRQGILEG